MVSYLIVQSIENTLVTSLLCVLHRHDGPDRPIRTGCCDGSFRASNLIAERDFVRALIRVFLPTVLIGGLVFPDGMGNLPQHTSDTVLSDVHLFHI